MLVEPVHEFRLERLPHHLQHGLVLLRLGERRVDQELAAQIRREHEDGVAEVDRSTLPVGEPAVVEHLQQHIEHFRMRLLDLVEEGDHRIGAPPHGLRQLTALLIADIARRRADETGDGELLPVLAHVDAHHRLLVVEQERGERFGQLGLADAGRPQEQERTGGAVGIGDACAGASHSIRHRFHRRLLPDQPPAEFALEVQQLLGLTLGEPVDGDARPGRDDGRDVVAGHLLVHHARVIRMLFRLLGDRQLAFDRGDRLVFDLRGLLVAPVAQGQVALRLRVFEMRAQLADPVEGCLLEPPAFLQFCEFGLALTQALTQPHESLLARVVLLFLERELFELHALDDALEGVDLDGAESISILRRLAASSIRSIALSGSCRAVM